MGTSRAASLNVVGSRDRPVSLLPALVPEPLLVAGKFPSAYFLSCVFLSGPSGPRTSQRAQTAENKGRVPVRINRWNADQRGLLRTEKSLRFGGCVRSSWRLSGRGQGKGHAKPSQSRIRASALKRSNWPLKDFISVSVKKIVWRERMLGVARPGGDRVRLRRS
jgi:hypothetical protein